MSSSGGQDCWRGGSSIAMLFMRLLLFTIPAALATVYLLAVQDLIQNF